MYCTQILLWCFYFFLFININEQNFTNPFAHLLAVGSGKTQTAPFLSSLSCTCSTTWSPSPSPSPPPSSPSSPAWRGTGWSRCWTSSTSPSPSPPPPLMTEPPGQYAAHAQRTLFFFAGFLKIIFRRFLNSACSLSRALFFFAGFFIQLALFQEAVRHRPVPAEPGAVPGGGGHDPAHFPGVRPPPPSLHPPRLLSHLSPPRQVLARHHWYYNQTIIVNFFEYLLTA